MPSAIFVTWGSPSIVVLSTSKNDFNFDFLAERIHTCLNNDIGYRLSLYSKYFSVSSSGFLSGIMTKWRKRAKVSIMTFFVANFDAWVENSQSSYLEFLFNWAFRKTLPVIWFWINAPISCAWSHVIFLSTSVKTVSTAARPSQLQKGCDLWTMISAWCDHHDLFLLLQQIIIYLCSSLNLINFQRTCLHLSFQHTYFRTTK